MECIFCKIISNAIPAIKVYEDEAFLAFLDIAPVHLGHTLVVPKAHHERLDSTPQELIGGLFSVAQRIGRAVQVAARADGFNVSVNNGAAAGQVVWHTHVHVIPRFAGDGLTHWPKEEYDSAAAEAMAQKIRAAANHG